MRVWPRISWMTSDGRSFDSEIEARDHQQRVDRIDDYVKHTVRLGEMNGIDGSLMRQVAMAIVEDWYVERKDRPR